LILHNSASFSQKLLKAQVAIKVVAGWLLQIDDFRLDDSHDHKKDFEDFSK
jgi:hypothetical protein